MCLFDLDVNTSARNASLAGALDFPVGADLPEEIRLKITVLQGDSRSFDFGPFEKKWISVLSMEITHIRCTSPSWDAWPLACGSDF